MVSGGGGIDIIIDDVGVDDPEQKEGDPVSEYDLAIG